MQDNVAEQLRQAIATGDVLGIVYHGGSRPGAFRQIIPIRIEGNQVRARCYTSNAVKVFAIAKIELRAAATPMADEVIWSMPRVPAMQFATLEEVAAHYGPQLKAKGWHVAHELCEGCEALRIFARLKNGKPRRTAAVTFAYEAWTYDLGVTPDGDIAPFNERPRVRPWSVRSNGKTNSWGRADAALAAFLAATGLASESPNEVATLSA